MCVSCGRKSLPARLILPMHKLDQSTADLRENLFAAYFPSRSALMPPPLARSLAASQLNVCVCVHIIYIYIYDLPYRCFIFAAKKRLGNMRERRWGCATQKLVHHKHTHGTAAALIYKQHIHLISSKFMRTA